MYMYIYYMDHMYIQQFWSDSLFSGENSLMEKLLVLADIKDVFHIKTTQH